MSIQITRRGAVIGLTTVAVSAGLTACSPAGAPDAAQALSWQPEALTPKQARTLEILADLIIPKTDTPGALDVGVPSFVDRAIGGWCKASDAELLRLGLDRVDADAATNHEQAFADLSTEDQVQLLQSYEEEANALTDEAHFFPLLRELVTVGFFTSETGATEVLRYNPVPGAYQPCIPVEDVGAAWVQ